jgi:cyclase
MGDCKLRIWAALVTPLLFAPVFAAAQPAKIAEPAQPPAAFHAPDEATVTENLTDVGNGIYVLTGALNNTTFAVGPTGIILVDAQFASRYSKINAGIRSVSDKPIVDLINTHYHGDHTGGNALFRQQGVRIVAHANVATRMLQPPPNPITGEPDQPAPAEALPDALYSGDGTLVTAGGIEAQLIHPAPAHTDGDTIVIFQAQNVICAGDLVGNHYPNIDLAVGGSIDGLILASDLILSHMNDATKVVPGHGPVLGKPDVLTFRTMLQTARDRIAKAKASGMSEQQLRDADLLADLDPKWKMSGNPMSSRFPINVYRSLP